MVPVEVAAVDLDRAARRAEALREGFAVEPRGDGKPVADMSKCIFCTLCAKKCPQEAIEVNRAEKTWKLNEDDCIACGNCETVCPKKAIVI